METLALLQWGRSFSERRTFEWRLVNGRLIVASMGPLFFRAENKSVDAGHEEISRASMGPLFFRAENNSRRIPVSPTKSCFNGAALFQSGERYVDRSTGVGGLWLQWGRSFSERRTARKHLVRVATALASMGPLFFRAENLESFPGRRWRNKLQWGRSFSERRTRSAW